MEKRVLVAAILSGLVIVLWFTLVAPPPKGQASPTPSPATTPATAEAAPTAAPQGTAEVSPVAAPPAVGGSDAADVVIGSEGMKLTLSPRGGVVRSIVLEAYRDPKGQALELVRAETPPPLSLLNDGPWNRELYRVEPGE